MELHLQYQKTKQLRKAVVWKMLISLQTWHQNGKKWWPVIDSEHFQYFFSGYWYWKCHHDIKMMLPWTEQILYRGPLTTNLLALEVPNWYDYLLSVGATLSNVKTTSTRKFVDVMYQSCRERLLQCSRRPSKQNSYLTLTTALPLKNRKSPVLQQWLSALEWELGGIQDHCYSPTGPSKKSVEIWSL